MDGEVNGYHQIALVPKKELVILQEAVLGHLWLIATVRITHSSVLGKTNSAGKVILGKSYTSLYDWGEMTDFHIMAQGSCTHAGKICFSYRP